MFITTLNGLLICFINSEKGVGTGCWIGTVN